MVKPVALRITERVFSKISIKTILNLIGRRNKQPVLRLHGIPSMAMDGPGLATNGSVAALREQRNIERKENAKGRQWRNFPG